MEETTSPADIDVQLGAFTSDPRSAQLDSQRSAGLAALSRTRVPLVPPKRSAKNEARNQSVGRTTQTLLDPHMQGSDPHMEGSGPSNPHGFEGPRAVWSVWESSLLPTQNRHRLAHTVFGRLSSSRLASRRKTPHRAQTLKISTAGPSRVPLRDPV